MRDACNDACDDPAITFVLEHAGMLEDMSTHGRSRWRDRVKRLAAYPNVNVKLSGLGTFAHAATVKVMKQTVLETVKIFGASRCLFGSNFPIEKLGTDYASLYRAFRSVISELSDGSRPRYLTTRRPAFTGYAILFSLHFRRLADTLPRRYEIRNDDRAGVEL